MTESTEKQTVAERASGLSDDLLESVDAGRRAVSGAVRKFVSSLEEDAPALADPARRKALVDAGLGLADELSTAVMELLRSISRSAGEAVRGRPDETKG